jgi:hypothetical protein
MSGSAANFDNVIPIAVAVRNREARKPISFGWVLALDLVLWSAVGVTFFLLV